MQPEEPHLTTLVDAWWRARHIRDGLDPETPHDWWDGFIAGVAMSIASASGLPLDGITLSAAVIHGCEIARIHQP